MAATDGEITRALNALSATLDDQKVTEYDAGRFQDIVTGSLAGDPKLEVHRVSSTSGFLKDAETGEEVASLKREGGKWQTEMLRDSRSSQAYVPRPG